MYQTNDSEVILEFKVIDRSNNWLKMHGIPMLRYLHLWSLHMEHKHSKKIKWVRKS